MRAWEGTLTLSTYQEGAPDPYPDFGLVALTRAPNYPYPMRTNLTTRRVPETWRTLNLENEYLSCTMFPDLGGHLYSCTDKLSGQPMFYANPSIKKALVGLRGSWAALGIELNFPAAHTRVTVSPVNFGLRQEKDRASVWVGDIDRITGMGWTVEFVLRAGSAALEQNVTLYNRTDVRHPYSWWSNAAVELHPGAEFVLPTHLVASHGTTNLDTWPVGQDGIDRRVVAHFPSSVGLFAYGSREGFLGVYQPASHSGVVHFADPAAVPGKKIWTWGASDDQRVRAELSDNQSTYVEIQAGLFPNQETFAFLPPHQVRRFTEYWIPVRALDGISHANADAVLYFERQSKAGKTELVAEVEAIHAIHGARIRIRNGTAVVMEAAADLDPHAVFTRRIPDPLPSAHYTFELADASGVLLTHTEGSYNAQSASGVKLGPQPKRDLTNAASEDDFLRRGEDEERNSLYDAAQNDYAHATQQFPGSARLNLAAGRLAIEQDRFQQGVRILAALPKKDAETHYYLGVAMARLDDEKRARAEFQAAAADPTWGGAASVEWAASLACSGDLRGALTKLSAQPAAANQAGAGAMEVALLRRTGQADKARARLAYWLGIDPTDNVLRFERALLGQTDSTLWPHLGANPARVLEIADHYMRLGFFDDALKALTHVYPAAPANQREPAAVLPQNHALVVYYAAYCRHRLHQDDAADWRRAASLPVRYVFPHRASSFPVLRAALSANPFDAHAHFLLALLDLDSGLTKQALIQLEQSRELNSGLPELHRLYAAELLAARYDPAGAIIVLREGLRLHPSDPALTRALDDAIRGAGSAPAPQPQTNRPPARAPLVSNPTPAPAKPPSPAPPPSSPSDLAAEALIDAASGQLGRAAQIFNSHNLPQERQRDDVRQAYIEIQYLKVRAQAAAGKCDSFEDVVDRLGDEDKSLAFTMYGFGEFLKTARVQYGLAQAEAQCGGQKAARKRWNKVTKEREPLSSPDYAFPALAEMRLDAAQGRSRVQTALAAAEHAPASSENRAVLFYTQGLLLNAEGRTEDALSRWQQGAQASTSAFPRYLNLSAIRENIHPAGGPR